MMSVVLILGVLTGCTGKKKQCYSVTLCEEWPVVDESITSNYEVEGDSSYYVLEKSSRFSSHWEKVTYVSSGENRSFNSILTLPKSSSLSLKNVKWNDIPSKVRSWVYTEDKDGAVDNIKAYDIDGNLLYTQYYSQKEYEKGDLKKCVITYVDAEGDTIQSYDKGASRAVVHLNNNGYRDVIYFQNAQGEKCQNHYGFTNFKIGYVSRNGNIPTDSRDGVESHTYSLLNDKNETEVSVNMDFLRHITRTYPVCNIDIEGEVKTECAVSDSFTYVTTSFEKDGTSIPIDDKIYKIVSVYDAKGHLLKRACQNKNGENVPSMLVTVYTYDEYGFLVLTELLSSDEKRPVNGPLGWQKREYKYDDNHFLSEIIYYDPSGYIVKTPHESYYGIYQKYDDYGRLLGIYYLGRSLNRLKDVLMNKTYLFSNDYFPQKESVAGDDGSVIYHTHYSYYKNGDEYYVGQSYSLDGENVPAFDNLFEKVVMYDKQGNRIVRYLDDKENILKSDSYMNESEAFSLKNQIKGEKHSRYCVINTNRWRFEGYMQNGEPHGEGCIEWTESGEVLVGNFHGWNLISYFQKVN